MALQGWPDTATRMLGLLPELGLTLFVQGGARAVSWPSRGQVEGQLQPRPPSAPQPPFGDVQPGTQSLSCLGRQEEGAVLREAGGVAEKEIGAGISEMVAQVPVLPLAACVAHCLALLSLSLTCRR